ncbi:MAG: hypothetical protein HOV79_32840 [Hamadaea sp.]|nr:hypothetical protein [Hamadaea sp.]
MDDDQMKSEFKRIELRTAQEHDRAMVRQYEEGLAFRRVKLEEIAYGLGRLDERLGGGEL